MFFTLLLSSRCCKISILKAQFSLKLGRARVRVKCKCSMMDRLQMMDLQLLYPLLDFFPDGLIRTQNRLLVDYNLSCVGLWSTNSGCNCRRICFYNNSVEIAV